MEFDEINALINIEREAYQRDLAKGIMSSAPIPSALAPSFLAERAAMNKVKLRVRQVEHAMKKLAAAMAAHAQSMKSGYDY